MLSNFLTSSYFQYKSDTDTVASWLANTAQKCGYAADLLTAGKDKPQGGGRLKGKARKLARAQDAGPQTYTIATKDFTGLAEFIAAHEPRVDVSGNFVSALYRAISVRKSHGANVSGTLPKTEEKQASDDRHSYFVGVLEHVRDTLRPLMTCGIIKDIESGIQKPSDTERLSPLFGTLEVFGPSEEFLNAPDAAPCQKSRCLLPLAMRPNSSRMLKRRWFCSSFLWRTYA